MGSPHFLDDEPSEHKCTPKEYRQMDKWINGWLCNLTSPYMYVFNVAVCSDFYLKACTTILVFNVCCLTRLVFSATLHYIRKSASHVNHTHVLTLVHNISLFSLMLCMCMCTGSSVCKGTWPGIHGDQCQDSC